MSMSKADLDLMDADARIEELKDERDKLKAERDQLRRGLDEWIDRAGEAFREVDALRAKLRQTTADDLLDAAWQVLRAADMQEMREARKALVDAMREHYRRTA